MGRKRSVRGFTDTSSARLRLPDVTGDAAARYERLTNNGTTWFDIMPTPANGTNGTIGAAFTWPLFNGESFVTIGQPAKFNFAGAFTIAAWSSQSIAPPLQGNEAMLARDDVGANRGILFSNYDNTGKPLCEVWTTVGVNPKGVGSVAAYMDGLYHFVVFVNDGTGGDMRLYVDGSVAATTVGAGGVMTVVGVDWEFGRTQAGVVTDYWTGKIDSCRLYGRALSTDEVLRDYRAGLAAH